MNSGWTFGTVDVIATNGPVGITQLRRKTLRRKCYLPIPPRSNSLLRARMPRNTKAIRFAVKEAEAGAGNDYAPSSWQTCSAWQRREKNGETLSLPER